MGGVLTKRSAEAAERRAVCAGAFGMVTIGMGLQPWRCAPTVNICKTPPNLLDQAEHFFSATPSLSAC